MCISELESNAGGRLAAGGLLMAVCYKRVARVASSFRLGVVTWLMTPSP